MISQAIFNRTPLTPNFLSGLPLGAVKPSGWLEKQLRRVADGLTGHLDEIWEDVGPNNGWLGGEGHAWERGPYYLDGLLPLAYLLNDEKLLAKTNKWIEWTLASQRDDGFFGPPQNDDWWPRMVMLKVLIQYYTASVDGRVLPFMYKYFKYQYATLGDQPLKDWAVARGADNTLCVLWLYNITGKPMLLKLAQKLMTQTLDWTSHYHSFPFTKDLSKTLPWDELVAKLEEEEKTTPPPKTLLRYHRTLYHLSHVVNNAMGLKAPGIHSLITGSQKDLAGFITGYEKLMKYHGVASGMFNGDEHLAGANPSRGTECCAVVELMFTLETLLAVDANPYYGDLLEKLAFNALPATLTPDQWGHQYLQQANQVKASKEKRPWYNNGDDSNCFGLEPNFGCCTANLHQGWPKFAASLWYATRDNGFAAISYAPCNIRFQTQGVPVRFEVKTDYPFNGDIEIHVKIKKPVEFPLYLRIPNWAEAVTIQCKSSNGKASPARTDCDREGFARIYGSWRSGDVVHISLPMSVRISRWYHQSASVEWGALLFGLSIDEKIVKTGERHGVSDIEVYPQSPWNFALLPEANYEILQSPEKVGPFDHPQNAPVEIKTLAAQIPEWTIEKGSATAPPIDPLASSAPVTITLVPYGFTSLRIAQFPMVR